MRVRSRSRGLAGQGGARAALGAAIDWSRSAPYLNGCAMLMLSQMIELLAQLVHVPYK